MPVYKIYIVYFKRIKYSGLWITTVGCMEFNTDTVSFLDSETVKQTSTFIGQHDMTGVVINSSALYLAKDTYFSNQEVFVIRRFIWKIILRILPFKPFNYSPGDTGYENLTQNDWTSNWVVLCKYTNAK